MICYSHHVTIGTSLLRNTSQQKSLGLTNDEINLLLNCSKLDVDAEKECERRAGAYREDPLLNKIRAYLFNNPFEASAELNSMKPFLDNDMVDKVTFYYYSDSGAAHLVYILLKEFLNSIYKKIKVDSASFESEKDLSVGLPRLMFEIKNRVKQDNNCLTILNITPGFKPESAYSMLGAIFSDVSSLAYYKHEAMKSTVGIPLFYDTEFITNTISKLKGKIGYSLEQLEKDEQVIILASRLNSNLPLKSKVSHNDLDWANYLLNNL